MSGTEGVAYATAAVGLAATCGLHLLDSRIQQLEKADAAGTPFAARARVGIVRLGILAAMVAFAALLAGLAMRSLAAARWPLGSPFEFTLAFAASVVLTYLVLHKVAATPIAGAMASLLALALLMHAFLVRPEGARAIQALPPVMSGIWFSLHTLLISVAYGALAVAGNVALAGLAMSDVPVVALVDWAMSIGYVALSLGMIAGAVWGETAWGEYWSWSVTETWTLITWWICTLYNHVRRRRGWRGRRAMGIAVLASIAVLVTFFLSPSLMRWARLQHLPIY